MDYWRFKDLTNSIREEVKTKSKGEMMMAAFIGWQLGAGGRVTFPQYLRRLGIEEDNPLTKEEIKKIKDKALETAKNIIELDKKRKVS